MAHALKLPIGKSGPVQQGSKVELGSLVIPDAGVWAFQAKRGATSPVIETSYSFYISPAGQPAAGGCPAALRDPARGYPRGPRRHKKWDAARNLAKEYLKRVEGGSHHGPGSHRHEAGKPGVRPL